VAGASVRVSLRQVDSSLEGLELAGLCDYATTVEVVGASATN
jgi:hypothetical protein